MPHAINLPERKHSPIPMTPGVSKLQVRQHARRLFRDQWEHRRLTLREWRLAERDLARRLEAEAL